jgi:signal transduction histidine kinase
MMSLHFVVEIIDNGIGIKKENLSKLFMEFNKLDE